MQMSEFVVQRKGKLHVIEWRDGVEQWAEEEIDRQTVMVPEVLRRG